MCFRCMPNLSQLYLLDIQDRYYYNFFSEIDESVKIKTFDSSSHAFQLDLQLCRVLPLRVFPDVTIFRSFTC
jgi:hypothetical protein